MGDLQIGTSLGCGAGGDQCYTNPGRIVLAENQRYTNPGRIVIAESMHQPHHSGGVFRRRSAQYDA